MRQIFNILFLFLLIPAFCQAQQDSSGNRPDTLLNDTINVGINPPITPDTNSLIDPLVSINDSIRIADSLRLADSLAISRDSMNKKINPQELREGEIRTTASKDYLFYYLVFLLIMFGLMRQVFSKYFSDFFRVFFRTTLKQRQLGEQLAQASLPSLLLNFFFVISAGLYINFILLHFEKKITENFWLQYIYCSGALAAIYIVKYTWLQFTGYIFNLKRTTDDYTFIVFSVNKVIGMMLLPFLLIFSFSEENFFIVTLYLSWAGIGLLLCYRFVLAYRTFRKEVRFNPFHFFLYVLAFELIPLLLIYKLLLKII